MNAKELFCHHISLFILCADRILSDPRMAYCPVPVNNGLAYLGALPPAKLGGYLEWWREYPEKSHDDNGLPIWFICGSPLSGISKCMSVTPEGEPVKSHTGLSVNSIAKSFCICQEKYQVQPTDCEPYTLDRVIEILTTSGQQECG